MTAPERRGVWVQLGRSTLWLLLLQGGSWCTDESSCAHRMEDTEDTLRKDGEVRLYISNVL